MSTQAHDTGPNGVTVDDLIDLLYPHIDTVLRRLEGDEFTTNEFIEIFLSIPEMHEAYHDAGKAWGERRRETRMVLHGQVIPGALRRSPLVEWIGFAYEESDEFAVPGRWRLLPQDQD